MTYHEELKQREYGADWLWSFFNSFCDNYCGRSKNCEYCPIKTVENRYLKSIKIIDLMKVIDKL